MKANPSHLFASWFRALAFLLLFIASQFKPLLATNRSWTGNVSGNWSDPNNWDPAGVPANGDALSFESGSHKTMLNDLFNLSLEGLAFTDNSDYVLNGNPFGFLYLNLDPGGSGSLTVNCSLIASNNAQISCEADIGVFTQNRSDLYLNNTVQASSGNLSISAGGYSGTPFAGDVGHIHIAGGFSGTGDISINTSGDIDDPSIDFNAPIGNSYSGTLYVSTAVNSRINFNSSAGPVTKNRIFVQGGQTARLHFQQSNQLDPAGSLEVDNGAQLILDGSSTTVGDLVLKNSSGDTAPSVIDTTVSILGLANGITTFANNETVVPTLKGTINLPAQFHSFVVTGAYYSGLDFQAQITGAGGFSKSGNAALILESSNTFLGPLTITQNLVDVRTNSALGATNGGVFLAGGSLTLRSATISNKKLFAQGTQPVTSDSHGSLLSAFGPSYWFGTVSLDTNLVVQADNLFLQGPITGAGGLELLGDSIVVSSGSANNTYTGPTLVHCTTAIFDAVLFESFAGPLIVGGGSYGPCEARWGYNSQTLGQSITLYPNGTLNLNNYNQEINNLTLNGGLVETGSGLLTVDKDIFVNGANVTAVINGNLKLNGGTSNTFYVADGSADPDLLVNASISGSVPVFYKQGLGTMSFTGANTYSGLTTIYQGILDVQNSGALGTASPGTSVQPGGTLRLTGSGSLSEGIVLYGTGAPSATGALEVSPNSSFTLSGTIILGAPATIGVDTSAGLGANGTIIGNASLIKYGPGTLTFGGSSANTYSGNTIVSNGILNLAKSAFVVAVPTNLVIGPAPSGSSAAAILYGSGAIGGDTVTVNANSILNLNGNNQVITRLNLNDGGSAQTGAGSMSFPYGGLVSVGSLSLLGSRAGSSISGNIALPANADLTFSVNQYTPIVFPPPTGPELDVPALIVPNVENPSFSPGGIEKNGSGALRLSANNSFKGFNTIYAGLLEINGSQPRSQVSLNAGTLGGTGVVANIYPGGSSGAIAPGHGPGILTCSAFYAGPGIFQVELNGPTAGTGYDQLQARGTVNLTGISLSASLNFTSSVGNQFTIIKNLGPSAVTGTFTGLAQNGSLYIGGEKFTVSYTGGSGKDVVLTRVVTPPRPPLAIQSVLPAKVLLIWPTNFTGFTLESSSDLSSNIWSTVVPGPAIIGTNNVVTNSLVGAQKFYRLKQ